MAVQTTEEFKNGGATSYAITIEYLKASDIKVRIDGALQTYVASSPGSGQYTVSGTTVTLGAQAASGTGNVHIYRETNVDTAAAVFVAGSSIRAADLNAIHDMARFGLSEARSTTLESDIKDGAVTSAKIKDGTIVNADVNASAAIDGSKIQASSGSNSGTMSSANFTKLAGIETGATADQTNAEIRAAVEAATDSNVFTDADHTKLNNLGTLNALSDVDTSGVADGKILKYSSSSSKFIIADDGGGSGGGGVTNGDKGDITIANAGTVSESFTIDNNAVTTAKIADEAVTLAKLPHGTSSTDGKFLRSNNGADPTFETVNTNLVADTSPQLGGNLDVQTNEITTSTTNGNVKVTPNGTGVVEIKGAGGADGTLQLNCSANSHGVKIKSPPHSAGQNYTLTLPSNIVNGQFLKTDANGNLSWSAAGSQNIAINTLSSSSGSGGGSATFNGSATRFTLSNPGTNAQAHIVSVNGVIQKPNSGTSPSEGFAIDGNDIIFASAPASGSDFFILTLGNAISINTPADDTVTSAKIVDGSIVNADINASAAIAGSKLADDSITEAKLDIHAAPSGTEKVLGYTANGMEWVESAAGATGGGSDKIFWENGQTVTTNYTITNNYNAMSAGPITINNGISVTIGTGENWTIV